MVTPTKTNKGCLNCNSFEVIAEKPSYKGVGRKSIPATFFTCAKGHQPLHPCKQRGLAEWAEEGLRCIHWELERGKLGTVDPYA